MQPRQPGSQVSSDAKPTVSPREAGGRHLPYHFRDVHPDRHFRVTHPIDDFRNAHPPAFSPLASRKQQHKFNASWDAMTRQKFVIVGAGPVGSLAALYAAKRGHDVEIYELRGGKDDLSAFTYTPSNTAQMDPIPAPRKSHCAHCRNIEVVSCLLYSTT